MEISTHWLTLTHLCSSSGFESVCDSPLVADEYTLLPPIEPDALHGPGGGSCIRDTPSFAHADVNREEAPELSAVVLQGALRS